MIRTSSGSPRPNSAASASARQSQRSVMRARPAQAAPSHWRRNCRRSASAAAQLVAVGAALMWTSRSTVWGMQILTELENGKRLAAELEVAEERLRFSREREILARLQHPNIARLLDAGIGEGDQPYLVLEYVEGVPLTDYCREHALPVEGQPGPDGHDGHRHHPAHQQPGQERDQRNSEH
mgnify:CR=1 FL=1